MTDSPSPDQVEMPQVTLNGPGPSTLADLQSQAKDLSFAAACMKGCLEMAASSEDDHQAAAPVPQALFNAGLISYRRAFSSGRAHVMPKRSRFSLSDALLKVLTPEQRTMHDEMLKIASEHIAHRVGDGEGILISVILTPPPQERDFAGIGSLFVQFMGPTEEFARGAVALCEFAHEVLQGGIKERSDALLANLRETADIDHYYAVSVTHGGNPPGDD